MATVSLERTPTTTFSTPPNTHHGAPGVIAELEASRGHLEAASASVSKLPPGLVKRRLEEALKGIDTEIQSQLWGHLRSNSGGVGGGGVADQGRVRAVPAMTVRATGR